MSGQELQSQPAPAADYTLHSDDLGDAPDPAEDSRPWRVGRSVGRTIYERGVLIGILDTPELAELAVRAVNATMRVAGVIATLECDPEPCGCEESVELRADLARREIGAAALASGLREEKVTLRERLSAATALLDNWCAGGRPVEATSAFLSATPEPLAESEPHAITRACGLLARAWESKNDPQDTEIGVTADVAREVSVAAQREYDALRIQIRTLESRVKEMTSAQPAEPRRVCRRCSDCAGEEHHWLEYVGYICKHCEAAAPEDLVERLMDLGPDDVAPPAEPDAADDDGGPFVEIPDELADMLVASGQCARAFTAPTEGALTAEERTWFEKLPDHIGGQCLRRLLRLYDQERTDRATLAAQAAHEREKCAELETQHDAVSNEWRKAEARIARAVAELETWKAAGWKTALEALR